MSSPTTHPRAPGGRAQLTAALSAGTVMTAAVLLLVAVERITGLGVFGLPFVASVAVVAMAPNASLARPAAVVGGYATASSIATAVTAVTGPSAYAATTAASVSLILMLLLRAPHAPAAVAAAAIGLTAPGPGHLLTGVLPAVAIVIGTALVAGRCLPAYAYPATWR